MKIADVRANAFAMPLTSPAFPRGPYRFTNREFLVITYRTDMDALRAVVPEPLEIVSDVVAYEFIRMPDSTGFGDYTETGQVIPVRFTTPDGTPGIDNQLYRLVACAKGMRSKGNARENPSESVFRSASNRILLEITDVDDAANETPVTV